jgi:hypothetical protein
MTDCGQRSIAEHVEWCRGERDSRARELAKYEARLLSIGAPKPGEYQTMGTITHIAFLRRTIEQLERIIAAYSAPQPQPESNKEDRHPA